MSSPNSATTWIGELKAGNAAVASQLWARYIARLLELARDRLRGFPRRVSDEEDVAQSAAKPLSLAVMHARTQHATAGWFNNTVSGRHRCGHPWK
jgi:hypothetical protein